MGESSVGIPSARPAAGRPGRKHGNALQGPLIRFGQAGWCTDPSRTGVVTVVTAGGPVAAGGWLTTVLRPAGTLDRRARRHRWTEQTADLRRGNPDTVCLYGRSRLEGQFVPDLVSSRYRSKGAGIMSLLPPRRWPARHPGEPAGRLPAPGPTCTSRPLCLTWPARGPRSGPRPA